jgi:23S rRNA pseudouridine955/2504/2580 synthase
LVHIISITQDDDEVRLDRAIRRQFPSFKQGQLEKLLRQGRIRVDSQKVKAGTRVHYGQKIEFAFDVPSYLAEQRSHITEIVAPNISDSVKRKALRQLESWRIDETDEWMALNKPAGIAVQGGSGTKNHIDRLLQEGYGAERPKLVHRIDKDTSGILLLAKSQKSARDLTALFKEQAIRKTYLAFCIGNPSNPSKSGKISAPIAKSSQKGIEKMAVDSERGLTAITLFETLYSNNGISMVCLRPLTGRTHQLRVHMDNHGTPILGDGKYAGRKAHPSDAFARKMHLHAHFLSLPNGHLITAGVPEHMQLAASIIGASTPSNNQFFPSN